MNIFNKSIQKLHKWTGIVISLFFIMWFVSGIVLLYHKYPRVTDKDHYAHMEGLDTTALPELYSLPGLTDSTAVKSLSVCKEFGEVAWTISGVSSRKENPMAAKPDRGGKYVFAGDTLIPQSGVTSARLDSIAELWAGSSRIMKVDTLHERQQWILYERYEKSLPILRYFFDNPDKTEVFLSQKSGEVLQVSTSSERIWSWVGAIPHKLYLPFLRKDVERWKNVLLIGGLLCFAAALTGMYMGIYYLCINRRKNREFNSPFKKRIWRYHHVAGLVFGIFLIGWGISGSLAMQRVPKWMVNYEGDYFVSSSKLWGKKPLPLKEYKLDYRDIFKKYRDVKSVSWEHFGKTPAYLIVSGDKEIYVDASHEGCVKQLEISKGEIENAVERYFGEDVEYTISLQNDYDEYYLSAPGDYPLPVWKVNVENEDGVRMYVSPSDGYVKYLNNNRMAKKWLFGATHFLNIKYFVLHKALRYASLWILSIGCVFVIATGIGISISKNKRKYHNHN